MILVFGSINIDLVARVPSVPRPGETVLSQCYETLFGSKGANQAVADARASQPSRVAIVAYVGDDAFSRSALLLRQHPKEG
jgi:ribokinase